MKRWISGAAGVEAFTGLQVPGGIAGWRPVCKMTVSCQLPQIILPVAQRACVLLVHLYQIKQRVGSQPVQSLSQGVAKAAEVPVVTVTQRENSDTQVTQIEFNVCCQKAAIEARPVIRCFTFSVGAHHKQRLLDVLQMLRLHLLHRQHLCPETRFTQLFGSTMSQLFRSAG